MQNFPRILLVDMNSFFASVEQQANPAFRGKPLGVCASLHETSCLIAASKEAKALGIKTGTLIYKAKQICPKIILVQAEPEKYREVNRRMVEIFYDYTDRVEVYSIDEAFLEINYNANDAKSYANMRTFVDSHKIRSFALSPLQVAIEIKQRIKAEIGEWLTCSVGIAPNKFMAKLAADLDTPDGLTIIWRSNLSEIYKTKKLSDLWGVAHGWTKRLGKLGITSPLQLLNYPVQNLISVFGKPGYYIWERVNGLEEDEIADSSAVGGGAVRTGKSQTVALTSNVAEQTPRTAPPNNDVQKSFGHSWVLNFRTTDKEKLKPAILRLAEKAARRMRHEGFVASAMYLSVRMVDARPQRLSNSEAFSQTCDGGRGDYLRRSKKLKFTIETGLELYEQAMIIWKNWKFDANVMHIAVGFTDLAPKVNQLELFDSRGNVMQALDYINNKYGEFTIRSGLLAKTADYAPDAIAFGK